MSNIYPNNPNNNPTTSASYIYLPQPPRAWNRFENSCTYFPPTQSNPDALIYVPLLKKTITVGELAYINELYKKGNVLQYKANSSNLTKQQRYAQIARGLWTNRTTTWATQSDTYSNPNTQSLRRVNYGTIPLIPGSQNVSGSLCPPIPVTPQYDVLPSTVVPEPGTEEPPIDPPPEEPPVGEESKLMPSYITPAQPEQSPLIADGGNLICSQVADICTGDIIKDLGGTVQCAPTTASDVPGIPQELCWNDGLQTYYPRQHLNYGTSGDKFPENYKGLVSGIKPISPILTIDQPSVTDNNYTGRITLNWEFNYSICIPITSFLLYQNGIFIKSISYQYRSTTLTNLPTCTNLVYTLIAHSTSVDSDPSNSVTIYITATLPPILKQPLVVSGATSITLNWSENQNSCPPSFGYNIYQDSVNIGTTIAPTTTFIVSGLSSCNSYNFYITSISDSNVESAPSNVVSVFMYILPEAPTLTYSITTPPTYNSSSTVLLTWTPNGSPCTGITSYNLYENNILIDIFNSGTTSFSKTNFMPSTSYSYYIIALSSYGSSPSSNTLSFVPPSIPEIDEIIGTSYSLEITWKIQTIGIPTPMSSFNINFTDGITDNHYLLQNPTTPGTLTYTTIIQYGINPSTTYNVTINGTNQILSSNYCDTYEVTTEITTGNWYLVSSGPNSPYIYTISDTIFFNSILIDPTITTITPGTDDYWGDYGTTGDIGTDYAISVPAVFSLNTGLTGGVLGIYWQLIDGVLKTQYPIYFNNSQINLS
jgi:hypothetical protein